MSETVVPEFFWHFPMRRVRSETLDMELEADPDGLFVLFLWGRDCPNCDVAKQAMLAARERFDWPRVRWLHDNVYDDPDMATRLGLHGIPVFFLFHHGHRLGRITAWPGTDAFAAAIERQIAATAA